MTRLKKVLIPISFNFQVRYFVRTELFRKLAEYCYPVVVLQWEQPDLVAELEAMGLRVYTIPNQPEQSEVIQLRKRINDYFLEKVVKTPTAVIMRDHEYQLIVTLRKKVRYYQNRVRQRLYSAKQFEADKRRLNELAGEMPTWGNYEELLGRERIEALFTTAPFLVQEDLLCRLAVKRGIPVFYGVLSFDNPTTRGSLPFVANRYAVWNRLNKEQLIRTYGAHIGPMVDVTGPPQFDFYFDPKYLVPREEWLYEKGLPPHRPVILYGANAKYFVPDEFAVVRMIDEAISSGAIAHNPVILLRPHPTDSYLDWQEFAAKLKNTYIERSLKRNQSDDKTNNKYSNFLLDDVVGLCSTLAHSAVHISYFSTLALDGICFDKPVVCPYFSPSPRRLSHKSIRRLYETEHYLPITRSGAVMLPEDEVQLIQAVNQALEDPGKLRDKRSKLKREYLNDVDGNACRLLVESFRSFLN